MKTFEEWLNESPKIISNLSSVYIKKKLIKPIQKAIATNSFENTTNHMLYEYTTPSFTLVVYARSKPKTFSDVIGGALFEPFKGCGVEAMICSASKKFQTDYSNILLEMFKFVSENDIFIMTDNEHTEVTMNLWKKWIKNGSAKNVKYFDKITCKELSSNVWGTLDSFESKSIIAKF